MMDSIGHGLRRLTTIPDKSDPFHARRTSFGIIGGGFRTGYFLRVAHALPEQFSVCGMVVRDAAKGEALEEKWNLKTYRTLDQFLACERPDFVVVSIPPSASKDALLALAKRGIPVLAETPPAADLNGLRELSTLIEQGAKVQIAEQYQYRPMHAARLAVVQSGILGSISEASVSISHGYHGVSLLRKLLGIRFDRVSIRAMRFQSPVMAGPNRSGPPTEERLISSQRDIAWLDFGDRLGIYDFTQDQHRSWIRSTHIAVRGVQGEICDNQVNVLAKFDTPLHLELKRVNRGEEENVEGHFTRGVVLGDRYVYQNPFVPARLYDDEIAVATCLRNMADYVVTGTSFYDLREAAQDHYVAMLIEEAIRTGETITSVPQPWG